MTDEQINVTIAEVCGWTNVGECENGGFRLRGFPPDRHEAHRKPIPDYCADLNAMHEAEKMLRGSEWETFVDLLADTWIQVAHATARQRAKAFLRTLGKWEGEERDIAKADLEKVVKYNTRVRNELEKGRAEEEKLRDEYTAATNHYNATINKLLTERDEARVEVERLKNHIPAATKMIRPEPSRLEIAAMLQAGWLANPESEIDNQHDWWLAQADALIEAAKGGVE